MGCALSSSAESPDTRIHTKSLRLWPLSAIFPPMAEKELPISLPLTGTLVDPRKHVDLRAGGHCPAESIATLVPQLVSTHCSRSVERPEVEADAAMLRTRDALLPILDPAGEARGSREHIPRAAEPPLERVVRRMGLRREHAVFVSRLSGRERRFLLSLSNEADLWQERFQHR